MRRADETACVEAAERGLRGADGSWASSFSLPRQFLSFGGQLQSTVATKGNVRVKHLEILPRAPGFLWKL